jgi:hypothetical protein
MRAAWLSDLGHAKIVPLIFYNFFILTHLDLYFLHIITRIQCSLSNAWLILCVSEEMKHGLYFLRSRT